MRGAESRRIWQVTVTDSRSGTVVTIFQHGSRAIRNADPWWPTSVPFWSASPWRGYW